MWFSTSAPGSVSFRLHACRSPGELREAAVKPDRAVVVVTHDNRVFHFGERIAHMDDGRIVKVEANGLPES